MTAVYRQKYTDAFTLTKHTQKRFNTSKFFRCYEIARDTGIIFGDVTNPLSSAH